MPTDTPFVSVVAIDLVVNRTMMVGWRASRPRRQPLAPSPASPPRARAPFDAIVVGGGHNGLTTAAYLARAGLRTDRAGAPADPRRRLRDRGGLARCPGLPRLLRRLDAAAEGGVGPAPSGVRLSRGPPRSGLCRADHGRPDLLPQRPEAHGGLGREVLGARRAGLRGLRGPARAHRLVPPPDDAPRASGARLAPAGRPPVAAARGRAGRRAVHAATSTTSSASSPCRSPTCSTTGSSTMG